MKNLYEVYYTIIHTSTSGLEWRAEYVDRQYAETKEEAIKLAKEQSHENKQAPDDSVKNFQALLID